LIVHARFALPVHLHLLALAGTSFVELSIVASHPIALAQCRAWVGRSGLRSREEENTAVAARKLARSRDKFVAVIGSEAAARAYGLEILARNIQDARDNITTFGLVVRREETFE
jgi:prephenate dehydratase